MRVREAILLDQTGKAMAAQLERIANSMPEPSSDDGGSGGGGSISDGFTNIFTVNGNSHAEKFWNALNAGGKYAGGGKEVHINYDACTPGSTGMQYVKWWIAYRDKYPELADGVHTVIKDCVICPEGDIPILIQFLYKSGSITFENCTFRNISFWFGRDYEQVITFHNCLIEDNQYHFITTGEWNQHAEYHIEGCRFRHMRPNFEEYRADVQALKLNGWAHGNIRSMGFNIKWFFRDSIFEDCMGALNIAITRSSHAPAGDDPKLVEFYMERCIIRKTNGAGLSFVGQPVTGVIRDCMFYNIGANRCNEEGYDLPTDKQIIWGSGTEDEPYVYACGVGSNAIFSYNWTPRHELTISNNWMYNMMENGVEGNYRELSYNHIENTGYRMDEGMWNPSTEGIYGTFAICKGNVIRNPYYNEPGIVITGWTDGSPCYYEDNVILYDKTDRASESVGFQLMIQTDHYDSKLVIRNNDIHGFSKKYSIYNQYAVYLGAVIHDIGEANNVLTNSGMAQREVAAIDFTSDESREIVRDPAFLELNEDGSPKEWKTLHCKAGVYTTGQDRFLRVQGTEYGACAVVAQDYHTNSDIYIARIRFQVRNDSGKIGIVPISLNDDGNVAKDAYNMVLHPNMATFDLERDGDTTKFVEVVHSMVVSQNFRIAIVNPLIDDSEDAEYRSKMDVKDISIQLTRCQRRETVLTNETLAVPGKLYDFSNQPSSYLPSNAFSVTYWIPQKTFSYGGSWTDACWMMGKYTAEDEGRGRVIVNADTKQYGQFVVWYKSHFDLELNGHTLECANADTYSFIALFNGADVHIKGPGTIKAKNFAVSLSYGCTLSIDPDVVIESTGVNANSGESNFALLVGGGDATHRTVLNIHGGTIGKTLSYAYTDINFDISEGAAATVERLQTNGKIFVGKNTKLINGGTTPDPTEVTNPKQMTGLFTCTNLTATYEAGHTADDLAVYGDESSVTFQYTDEKGEVVEGETNLTGAFGRAVSTKDTRKGAMNITLAGEVYTYTGIWYGDLGEVVLDLNGYSVKNDYQNYALNLNGGTDLTIMDSNPKVEGGGVIESTQYCAIIANNITLRIGRCIIRQKTGICIGGGGSNIYLEDESKLEGKIGLNLGTNTTTTLNGGSITATKFGIQASPEDNSTTAVTVHSGTITSEKISIFAKDLTFDAVAGKTATLTGELSLTQNATITAGTRVMTDGTVVSKIKRHKGTVVVSKEG